MRARYPSDSVRFFAADKLHSATLFWSEIWFETLVEDSGRITVENTCSECGQSFSSATKICPNDGTRLVAPPPEKEKKEKFNASNTKALPKEIAAMKPADESPLALSAGSLMAQILHEEPLTRKPDADNNGEKGDETSEKSGKNGEKGKNGNAGKAFAQQKTLDTPEETKTKVLEDAFGTEDWQTQEGDLESSDGSAPATFAREAANKLIGTIVNNQYKIVGAIGYGGMSVVLKAKDLKLDKFIALKMLLPHLMLQSHSMARFQQEAHSASSLNHPNVVSIHNYGETESGQPFLVMDLIEGSSLASLIKKEKHLPVDRALNIFIQLASALSHAHQKGIVHRDLKPSNVLLCDQNGESDVCKIVDFGIAKLLPHEGRDAVSLTQTGDVFGSPLYMSPEQCKGEKLDAKADIYSMGCLMYETLCGTPPHTGNNMLEVLYRHMNEVPKDFKSLKLGISVPQRLEALIFKALAKEPAARPASMQAVHDELKKMFFYRKSSFLGRLVTSWELFVLKRRPRKKSEFIMFGALAVSLVALFAACAYLVSQYAFADESEVFKQTVTWKTPPPPRPGKVGQWALSIYQNDVAHCEGVLRNSPQSIDADTLERMVSWGNDMAKCNRWEEAEKAFSLALECSKLINGEVCLPSMSLRRQYAEACFNARDYAFAAREYTIYMQRAGSFVYGEKASNIMNCIVQTGESYYYIGQFSDAVSAYRHFFASTHGEALEWANMTPLAVGQYVEEARQFQSTEGYALLMSHAGDCLVKGEVLPRAKDYYTDAAARWGALKSADNEALAYLKVAQIQETLKEDPRASYEAALKALKSNGSLLITCITEKKYADYMWKQGDPLHAILLKMDYSRQVPKVER